jgi:uncharacterized protein (DUF2147 family)
MKKTLLAMGFCLLLNGLASVSADPAEGFWISIDDKTGAAESGWEFYQVDGVLLGKMLSGLGQTPAVLAVKCRDSYRGFPIAGKVSAMPMLGTPWMFGFRAKKSGEWVDGHVIDPSSGGIYKCKLTHRPADGKKFKTEVLEVRGELVLGIGRSQYWRRATREEASALR